MRNQRRTPLLAVAMSAALLVAACSSGSDGTPADSEPEATVAAGSDDTAPDDSAPDASAPSEDAEPADTDASSDPAPLENQDQITSEGEGGDVDPATLQPVAGGEIDWAIDSDGTGFDTTGAIAPGSIRVITALNASLVTLDPNGGWQPLLAESLVPSDDFMTWTITMRPGLTFHDGEPVDAEAVRANMQTFKDSPTVGFAFGPVETITAVSDLAVEVTMSSPWATFPFSLYGQGGWMVSPSTIGTNETFVGTGPFMLESWTPNDSARVVRNPNYWRADEGLPYLDAINFKFLVEQTVRRQAFDAGDVDGYQSPGDTDIIDFLDDDEADVWIGTGGANEYLWLLNTTAPPFDDVRVRRAMAHAIDRDFIIETFRSGLTTPADGPLDESSIFYTPSGYPEFDPAAAQALVDEYEAEVGPILFELTVQPDPSVVEVADVMLSFLADVGIEGSTKEIGPGQSVPLAIADDFQAFSWAQFGPPDPDGLYVFFHSSGGVLNWTNLVSADIDAGLDAGRVTDDPEARKAGYAQFLTALGTEVPMLWIDHLNGVEAVVTIPAIRGIGVPGVTPEGSPTLPMTDGSFFSWSQVWLEQ
ncbi:MAG: ABC transporter substrate-binding protein [Ilumatobacter sp.]